MVFRGFLFWGEKTKKDNLGGIDRGLSRTSIRGKRQIPPETWKLLCLKGFGR